MTATKATSRARTLRCPDGCCTHKLPAGSVYDAAKADRVVRFAARYLRHMKGRWAGQPFVLEHWQEWEIVRPLFGIVERDTGLRWYREALIGLARKNGKSELAAALVLYMLTADGEYGAEVYSLAGDKKQASLVYKTAASMVKASPIRSAVKVYRSVMEVGETGSNYWVLSADADLQHGTNPHAAVIDEYHIHRDDEQYVAMRTGTAARTQPLIITITTAGAEKKGPLWDLYSLALSGKNPRLFVHWHGAPEGADLHDPKVWKAANPASWVTEKFLQEQYDALPLPVFARLHLNYWYEGTDGETWITRDRVLACVDKPEIDVDRPLCVAIDAASRADTTAVMAVQRDADGRFHRRCWHYAADDTLGYFDYSQLEDLVRDLAASYDLRRVAFDPFQMVRSAQMLDAEGIPVEMFPQNDTRMVPATGLLYELIVEGRLVLDDCPTCLEQLCNAGIAETARGFRLHKKKSRAPIDAAVALAMAVQLAEWEWGEGGAPTSLVI